MRLSESLHEIGSHASTQAQRDRQLKVLGHASFAASTRRYGSPRMHRDLIAQRSTLGATGWKLYLAAILDVFSRFVVGWAISGVTDRPLVIAALEMALTRRCPGTGLLHHSDRGSPYASQDDRTLLQAHGITCRMSRSGDCVDHAVMEAFFSTVTIELGDRFETATDATRALFEYLDVFDNQRRRHSTIGDVSPAVFEQRARSAGTE